MRVKFGRDRDANLTDDAEINAFLGLLIMAGKYGSVKFMMWTSRADGPTIDS